VFDPFVYASQHLFHFFWYLQFFALNKDTLMSLVELPTLEVPGGGATSGLRTARSQVNTNWSFVNFIISAAWRKQNNH